MAIAVEYTFMPLPGANAAEVMATMHAGAALWKKHGASPRLWAVSLGEIGNMVFRVEFASVTEYGKCLDALNADPAFRREASFPQVDPHKSLNVFLYAPGVETERSNTP